MTAASTITTKEFADALHTDPRTVRKYLRSVTPKADQPGKGSRWELAGTKTAIAKHLKSFTKWQEDEAKRNAARLADAAAKAQAKVDAPAEIEEDSETEVEVEVDPTDEDLEMIDEDPTED